MCVYDRNSANNLEIPVFSSSEMHVFSEFFQYAYCIISVSEKPHFLFECEIFILVSCSPVYSFSILLQKIIWKTLLKKLREIFLTGKSGKIQTSRRENIWIFQKSNYVGELPMHHRVTDMCHRNNGEFTDIPA